MKVFVTVGTTKFDDLIESIIRESTISALKSVGVTEILLQTG